MSADLHLLLPRSGEDSATETEKVLDSTDDNEHLSLESGENPEEMENYDANSLYDEYSMSTDVFDEYNTDSEENQDGTAQEALPEPLAETYEEEERSVLDLPQPPERDASLMDRSLIDASIPTESQLTSDEGASANFISRCKNIPPEEAEVILSHEQASPEGITSDELVNSSETPDELDTDINSLAEEIEVTSDSAETATENARSTSLQEGTYPGSHEAKSRSLRGRANTIPQCDTANVLPRKEEEEFLSEEQSPQENNLVQTLEDNSSRFDSGEDASSDFSPWCSPEREDEVISQGETTPEGSVSDSQTSSPKTNQVSFLNSSDTTNPSQSFSEVEGATRLNSGQKLKYPGKQMNSEESEQEEGASLTDTKTRQQCGTLGHGTEYSVTSAGFAVGIRSSYNLPWYKYLIGREHREALGHARYNLLKNLAAPPDCRMHIDIARVTNFPFASE